MTRIELPGGGWAILRDPEDVTEGERRPLKRLQRRVMTAAAPKLAGIDVEAMSPQEALKVLGPLISGDDLDMLEDVDDLVVTTLVESWSYDPPVTVEGLLKLKGNVRDALVRECKPLVDRLLSDGTTTDEDVLNPDSPTAPANGSAKP